MGKASRRKRENRPDRATAPPPLVAPEHLPPLERIRRLSDARNRLAQEEAAAWQAARSARISWAQLAAATGLTRAGAQHRYRAVTKAVQIKPPHPG